MCNLVLFGTNNSGATQIVAIPIIQKFTVQFIGRRFLPATTTLDLLGLDVVGEYDKARTDAAIINPDGRRNLKHSGKRSAHVPEQAGTSQALANQDDETDQKEPVSIVSKARMLYSSSNPYWRGHPKDCSGKIHKLYLRQRVGDCTEGAPNEFFNGKQKQEDKERGDNGADTRRKEMLRDMPEISTITTKHLQTSKIQTTENSQN